MQMPTGAAGAFMMCLMNCMSSNGIQMSTDSCMQQLGCALDYSTLDLDTVGMASKACMISYVSQLVTQSNSTTG